MIGWSEWNCSVFRSNAFFFLCFCCFLFFRSAFLALISINIWQDEIHFTLLCRNVFRSSCSCIALYIKSLNMYLLVTHSQWRCTTGDFTLIPFFCLSFAWSPASLLCHLDSCRGAPEPGTNKAAASAASKWILNWINCSRTTNVFII